MRKQYNFWPSDNGYDAWDVDRLVELSATFPVRDVPLSEIWEIDTVYWGGDGVPLTVREIADHVKLVGEVDLQYPIILASDGRVMDGMHRIVRALLEGRDTISARQFVEMPPPDFHNIQPSDLPYPEQ